MNKPVLNESSNQNKILLKTKIPIAAEENSSNRQEFDLMKERNKLLNEKLQQLHKENERFVKLYIYSLFF